MSFLHVWLHLDHVPPLLKALLVASHLTETKSPPALTSSTLPFSPSTPATPTSSLYLDHSRHTAPGPLHLFPLPRSLFYRYSRGSLTFPRSLLECRLVKEAFPDDSFEKNVTPPSHYPSPFLIFFHSTCQHLVFYLSFSNKNVSFKQADIFISCTHYCIYPQWLDRT